MSLHYLFGRLLDLVHLAWLVLNRGVATRHLPVVYTVRVKVCDRLPGVWHLVIYFTFMRDLSYLIHSLIVKLSRGHPLSSLGVIIISQLFRLLSLKLSRSSGCHGA